MLHKIFTTTKISAVLLLILGGVVLAAWHNPTFFNAAYAPIVLMAYSTAISFFLSGVALLCLTSERRYLAQFFALYCVIIAGLSLLELCCYSTLNINLKLMIAVAHPPLAPVLMAPSTALSFTLAGCAIIALCNNKKSEPGASLIFVSFLNLLIFTIGILAALGHFIGLVPAFEWFGVKMAPQTALGFLILSTGLASYSYKAALVALGRLNFFNHMVIAFGFMTLLVMGAGLMVSAQIDTVSSITRELYKNPLQVNNAVFRVRESLGNFNRQLKDIAIQPGPFQNIDILSQVVNLQQRVQQEIALIRQKDHSNNVLLQQFEERLAQWREDIEESDRYLKSGDFEKYSLVTLNKSQQNLVQLEAISEIIILNAQRQIEELNTSVNQIESNAKKLILLSILGLIGFGLLVVYVIAHSLTSQLHQLRYAMLDIARKKTDTVIPFINHTQEIGEMARSLAVFAQNIEAGVRMEARMKQIIEAAPNGIIMINSQGIMEVVNQQAEKIFGYHRDQMLGHPIEQLLPQRMVDSNPGNRYDFFTNPSPRPMGAGRELYALRQDGIEFPVEIGLAPIQTEEGLKVLASVVDISERKKAAMLLIEHQAKVERANRELERINKELEAFAYVASHDLKSPLRGVAQLSTWIEEDLAEHQYDSVTDHTRMLRNRISRMEKLLDDMLLFYRAGKNDKNSTVIDVKRMALDLFEIQNNKPDLHLELAADLPVFTTLKIPFEQVLRNLFSNAIKHHDLETGKIRLDFENPDGEFYMFSVCDDGPGIPDKYQQRIFGMFQTLKPRDELEGSGMGLALIKKIVENYGGNIAVKSEGRGACFRFSWPKNLRGDGSRG